jgi:glycosyltransferase involved in cell wall biosynthesis
VPKLVVIGDGEESSAIKKWVKDRDLQDKVVLTGAIYNEEKLSRYFTHAIMCISPDQAGLAVLQSFGYGTPFVTHKDAITGGERLNIKNNETGILLDSFDQMTNIICDSSRNRDFYIEMGRKAKQFYDNNRTIPHMVNGFLNAITFVTKE